MPSSWSGAAKPATAPAVVERLATSAWRLVFLPWPRPVVGMLLAGWGVTMGRPAFITSTVSDILGPAPANVSPVGRRPGHRIYGSSGPIWLTFRLASVSGRPRAGSPTGHPGLSPCVRGDQLPPPGGHSGSLEHPGPPEHSPRRPRNRPRRPPRCAIEHLADCSCRSEAELFRPPGGCIGAPKIIGAARAGFSYAGRRVTTDSGVKGGLATDWARGRSGQDLCLSFGRLRRARGACHYWRHRNR